jgi:hypothetical protein
LIVIEVQNHFLVSTTLAVMTWLITCGEKATLFI